MSKGLEAFNRIKSYFHPKQLLTKEMTLNDLDTIEKELKQAQKDKEMLDVFKNALTIEHHDYPTIEQHNDSEDVVSYLVKELYTIKQSELEKDMRKALREWVLKNAFPKELKRLEELEKAFKSLSKDDEKAKKELSKEIEKNRAFEIIKDRLIVVDKGKYIEVFCEFSIPSKSKKYDLLKEVLL